MSSNINDIYSDFRNKWLVTALSIRDLMDLDLDLNPFYQRDEIWPTKYMVELIYSILNGIPINNMHLVKHSLDNGGEKYIGLDGKQRITAIKKFMQGELEIEYKFKTSDESDTDITFVKLQNLSRSDDTRAAEAKKLVNAINIYKIDAVIWNDLDLFVQSRIFDTINYSKQLSKEERLLAQNFYTKVFAKFLLKKFRTFSRIANYGSCGRGTAEVYILKLFYLLCGGHAFFENEKFSPQLSLVRKARKVPFEQFIRKLNNKIVNYVEANKHNFTKSFADDVEQTKMITEFKWFDLDKFARILNGMDIDLMNGLADRAKKTRNCPWLFTRFGIFILEKFDQNIITHLFYKDNRDNFSNILVDLLNWVMTDRVLTQRTFNVNVCDRYEKKLEELFHKYIKDVKKKNNPISATDMMKAILTSGGKCRICDKRLSKENAQFDHINPKSLVSTSQIQLLCTECNLLKGANTQESISMMHDNMGIQLSDL